MKIQNIILVIVAVLAIIIATTTPVQTPMVNVAPELQNNPAAREIGAMGIPVYYEELGEDSNGYTVRGQTWFYTVGNTEVTTKVILDDDVNPNSYDANAILYHEMGHIINSGDADTEAAADEYAATRGYNIVDAYHGIH